MWRRNRAVDFFLSISEQRKNIHCYFWIIPSCFLQPTTNFSEHTSPLPAPAAPLGQLWWPRTFWFSHPCFWKSSIILCASSCFHSGWQRYLPVIPQCSLSCPFHNSTFHQGQNRLPCSRHRSISEVKCCLLENQTKQPEVQSLVTNTVFQKQHSSFTVL